MTASFRSFKLSALLVCFLLAMPTFAQEPDDDASQWDEMLNMKVSFESGTPAERFTVGAFIREIQSMNESLNVIVDHPASEFALPVIRFRDVPMRGALRLIEQVSNGEISVEITSVAEGADANMVFVRRQTLDQATPVVRAMSVAHLLQSLDKAAFLSAFEEGFSFMKAEVNIPEVRLHEATGLFFVRGTIDQVNFAEEIVRELSRGADVTTSQRTEAPQAGGGGLDGGGGSVGGGGGGADLGRSGGATTGPKK